MSEISDFGVIIFAVSATVFVEMRLADRLSLPYAAVILVGAVAISEVFPSLQDVLSIQQIERLAVVALVVILIEGGLHIGARRFRESDADRVKGRAGGANVAHDRPEHQSVASSIIPIMSAIPLRGRERT